MMPKMCDFCASMPAEWVYLTQEFEREVDAGYVINYAEDWFACGECSRMIEEEDMKGVVERSVNHHVEKYGLKGVRLGKPETRQQLINQVYQLYVEFMKRRKERRRQPYDPRRVGKPGGKVD